MLLAALLAVATFQSQDALIPTPEGWLSERIPFPLDFAPEFGHTGHEDLAFAPGMFKPGSDSHFSYALAIRLDGDVLVDAPMLTRFLELYYRGLLGAVGSSRSIDRDPSTIRVVVRPNGAEFRAVIDMYDAFTDGADLRLEIDLAHHAAPRATELLGLASPLPREAAIWKELRAIGDTWRAARPPPVLLNHLYAIVDREAYDAFLRSSFLRDTFAVSEERTTVRKDMTYTGAYFYGRRTYFEVMPVDKSPGLPLGATGLALGTETAGGNEAFARRLSAGEVASTAAPATRQLEARDVPWFQMLGIDARAPRFSVFVLEYDPRFLASWHGELEPKDGGTSRAAVLERYAAALGKSKLRAEMPFADVSAVTLALTDAERERMLAVCAAAGYEVESQGETWTCHAPQYRIVISRSAEPGGITGFELALSRPVEHEPIQLGRARLVFAGERATLTLR